MRHYEFALYLNGSGGTPQEAWEDICEAVKTNGLGEMPEIFTSEKMEGFDDE
jgi:hypothetical protein